HVEADDRAEMVGPRLPALHEGGRGRIGEVADVANRHTIAGEFGAGQPRDVGLPVARVARRDREPPRQYYDEGDDGRRDRPPPRAHRDEQEQDTGRDHHTERRGQRPALRPVDPDGGAAPRGGDDDDEIENESQRADCEASHLVATCSRRIRLTSRIVSGSAWHECGDCTTFSDSTPSRWALSYATTPSVRPVSGPFPRTAMIEFTSMPRSIGLSDSVWTKRLPGRMFSTAVGMSLTAFWA